MNLAIIIAVVSLVWMVIWKHTVLDTMPGGLADTHPVKGVVALLAGGPMIWIIAVMLAFVYGLKRISLKFGGQSE